MVHLDYLSCFLTVLATILVVRKSWTGLVVAIGNSLIVCLIGLRTSQFGFIPANLFCICIYAFSMRSWLKERTHTNRDEAEQHVFAAHTRLKVESVNALMDSERRTGAVATPTAVAVFRFIASKRSIVKDDRQSVTLSRAIQQSACGDLVCREKPHPFTKR
jgi:hypothetical protein